jgi:hypothetical protein
MYNNNVTICIPVFERKEFFEESLNSAINQRVKCPIVVIDNGSSTDYFEKKCIEKDIMYYKNDTNIGMFANWNRCIEVTETEYIFIFGDDDILDERFIELFTDSINKYPFLDVFYSDLYFFHSTIDKKNISINNQIFKFPFGFSNKGNLVINYAAKYGLGFPTISCVFKKEKFGYFYTRIHASNDWLLFYSNIENCKIFGSSERLVFYRKHIFSDTSNSKTISASFLSQSFIYDQIIKKKCESRLTKNVSLLCFISMLNFRASTSNYDINNLLSEDNIYSNYLNDKINSHFSYKLIFILPPIYSEILSKISNISLRIRNRIIFNT